MTYELILQEEASLEILEAYIYYEDAQKGLGEKFMKHLDKYLRRIQNNPKHFQVKKIIEKHLSKSFHTSSFLTLLIPKSLCSLFSTRIKIQQKSLKLFENSQ